MQPITVDISHALSLITITLYKSLDIRMSLQELSYQVVLQGGRANNYSFHRTQVVFGYHRMLRQKQNEGRHQVGYTYLCREIELLELFNQEIPKIINALTVFFSPLFGVICSTFHTRNAADALDRRNRNLARHFQVALSFWAL